MNFDPDALTGCLNKRKLEFDLKRELGNSDAERFRETFLCCDLHHLVDYLNIHGHHGGDAAILAVAKLLQAYDKRVYRFGGDEFIVRGLSTPIEDANERLPLQIRQCVVNVNLPIQRGRDISSTSWVLAHLQLALVQPNMVNDTIDCVSPSEDAG